jgi:uncharacterized protein (TIGR03546 family)
MLRIVKKIWGHPSRTRIALSAAIGVALGIALPFSSVWFFLLLTILVIRTHIPATVLSWLAACVLALIISPVYEPLGRLVLNMDESFWRGILSLPVVCCLDINRAAVMGSAVIASLCGTVVLAGISISSLGHGIKTHV